MIVYFARGVGPVQIATDDTVWTLSPREFHEPDRDPSVTLELAGNTFTNLAYSGSCDRCVYPAPMSFTVTLSNRFEQPLCLDPQVDVDVNIVDPLGRLLNTWPTKPDIFPPDPQILFPGGAKSWAGTTVLIDRSGSLLMDSLQVWASVRFRLLPPGAVNCFPPYTTWMHAGAEQDISVFIRWVYVGGYSN